MAFRDYEIAYVQGRELWIGQSKSREASGSVLMPIK
jgi:hypothetical protein